MSYDQGDSIHGEIISADASGAGVLATLYKSGSTDAHTLAADERITVTDVIFISTAGGVYDLVFGAAAAGRHIVKGNADILGGLAHHFETPRSGPLATNVLLIAAAGQVNLVFTGYITKG